MKEAFRMDADGNELAVDSVRFAVGSENGLRSKIWSAMNSSSKSSDMFLSSGGLSSDMKVTFHLLDAVVAYRSEKMNSLIERGVIEPGTNRQTASVPIRPEPFLVASIGFYPGVLIRPELAQAIPPRKHLMLIPGPTDGHFLRVHVIHSYDRPEHLIDPEGRPYPWFARLRSGNRHLTFSNVEFQVDDEQERANLLNYIKQIPARQDLVEIADNGDLAAVLWGTENGYINFLEIHNIVVEKAVAGEQPGSRPT